MYMKDADWLDQPRDLDRLLAEARRMRAETMARYIQLAAAKMVHGVAALLAPFRRWQERMALDAELSGMTDYELRDIGLTRGDIDQVVAGTYRDERGQRTRKRPILVRLDPGPRRLPDAPKGKPKAA